MIKTNKSADKAQTKPAGEFYKELPKLSVKDSMGVVVALVLLGVIGLAGYIWLSPSLAFSSLVPQRVAAESGSEQVAAMAAVPEAEAEQIRCESCGMFYAKSPTQVIAGFAVKGKDVPEAHYFESLGCLFDYMLDEEITDMPASLAILDYSSFGTDKLVMLDAEDAYYLYDTERMKGSMAPFIGTFKTKDAAQKAQKEIGGELVEFNSLHELMREVKGIEDTEVHDHSGHEHSAKASGDVYVCSCSGGCCDDIQSDKPGECSKCGMTLVKK